MDLTCWDQVSSAVAIVFTERVRNFASDFMDLDFLRNDSIRVFVKFTDLVSGLGSVDFKVSDNMKLWANGSILSNSAVFSFKASFTFVSTIIVFVWYSTKRFRWFSFAVLDHSYGKDFSSENRCFFTIFFLYSFALRFMAWTNWSTTCLFSVFLLSFKSFFSSIYFSRLSFISSFYVYLNCLSSFLVSWGT